MQKNDKKFAYVPKKQYLCTVFRKRKIFRYRMSNPQSPFIDIHTSLLLFQLRSVQPFLEKERQMDKEQTLVLI